MYGLTFKPVGEFERMSAFMCALNAVADARRNAHESAREQEGFVPHWQLDVDSGYVVVRIRHFQTHEEIWYARIDFANRGYHPYKDDSFVIQCSSEDALKGIWKEMKYGSRSCPGRMVIRSSDIIGEVRWFAKPAELISA